MRLRDDNKRRLIVQTAVKLFSEHPFHQVRVDDVAAAAGLGKGTLYIYFKNKEELYYSTVYDSFAGLVERLEKQITGHTLRHFDKMRTIIRELVAFSVQYPQLFEVMRNVGVPDASTQWDGTRQSLSRLIENVIRQGMAAGEFQDANPENTALYLPSMVRAVMQYRPGPIDADALALHIAGVILGGIGRNGT